MNEVEQLANKKFEDWKESFIRLLKEEIDVWAYDNTARWGISVVDIIDLKGKIQNLAGEHFQTERVKNNFTPYTNVHSPLPQRKKTINGMSAPSSSSGLDNLGIEEKMGNAKTSADKSQSSEGVNSGHRSPETKPASDSGADSTIK